ncbi:MAG: hypothetical protein R6V12_13490, partial [Candidatus Hydrogenedentota bacterium]
SITWTLTDPDGLGFLRTNMGPVYTRDTQIGNGLLIKQGLTTKFQRRVELRKIMHPYPNQRLKHVTTRGRSPVR